MCFNFDVIRKGTAPQFTNMCFPKQLLTTTVMAYFWLFKWSYCNLSYRLPTRLTQEKSFNRSSSLSLFPPLLAILITYLQRRPQDAKLTMCILVLHCPGTKQDQEASVNGASVQMNKVHFSSSLQSEENGTRNEMKGEKKREETSRCLPASAAKWAYLESNPFPRLMWRPFSLLLRSLFLFVNPVPCKVH